MKNKLAIQRRENASVTPHSKYIHRHAFPLVIGEMQIKTAKGNHPMCTRGGLTRYLTLSLLKC